MRSVRCSIHDLACGPDGRCVVCKRELVGASTRRVWVGLGALALAMGAAVGYRALAPRTAPMTADRAAVTAATEPIKATASPVAAPFAFPLRRADQLPLYQPVASAAHPPASPPLSASPSEPDVQPEVRGPAAAATVSLRDVHVVVYTTGWCSVCKRAKAWMARQGIPYEERDIDRSSEYAQRMRALNPRGSIPTFDVEGDVMVGFSENALATMMQNAARRQAARRQL
jgi:glutaredoxin